MPPSALWHKSVLPSGMRIVSERIPAVRSAALGVWVTVGSRHESAAENGISHFIEHMAFKGTKSRSALDIARTVEQGGGMINAFTGKELTCFHVHVLDERLPDALDILSDILRESVFDPAEMEKEKQVILDEIRDHEDMPDDVAHEHFVQRLFGSHSLARPILGPPKNVSSFSRQALLRFIDRHYTPDRIVVTAAGNINHAAIVKRVQKILDFDRPARASRNGILSKLRPGIDRIGRPIKQAHIVMGTRGLPYAHRERFALSVLSTLLGGGMSSRLFQNIRERHGVAYTIYSFLEMMRDTGVWGIYLATDPERANKARELVLRELADMRSGSINKDELDGVKTQLKGNMMLGLENVSSRMMRLGRMEIYLGKYASLDEVIKQIDSVTVKRVQSLADQFFNEKKLVTTIVEPEKKGRSKPSGKKTTVH